MVKNEAENMNYEEEIEGVIGTCYMQTQDMRKKAVIELLRCAGCYVVESEDMDIDVTNPDEENCKKMLDTLEEQGFRVTRFETGGVHIHSNIRKKYSWLQRW